MRTLRRTASALTLTVLLAGGTLAGCGEDEEGEGGDGDSAAERAQEEQFEEAAGAAADQSVCAADATALAAPYDGFPSAWTFPADTTVYDVEDREDVGVIVTAISTAPFADVLAHLNGEEQELGFTITGGETEDDDAEANWSSNDFTGRWAIRKSGTCPGETVVQVLATPAG